MASELDRSESPTLRQRLVGRTHRVGQAHPSSRSRLSEFGVGRCLSGRPWGWSLGACVDQTSDTRGRDDGRCKRRGRPTDKTMACSEDSVKCHNVCLRPALADWSLVSDSVAKVMDQDHGGFHGDSGLAGESVVELRDPKIFVIGCRDDVTPETEVQHCNDTLRVNGLAFAVEFAYRLVDAVGVAVSEAECASVMKPVRVLSGLRVFR